MDSFRKNRVHDAAQFELDALIKSSERQVTRSFRSSSTRHLAAAAAAAEFICHEKYKIMCTLNLKDRPAARKEYFIVLAAHDN